MAIISWGKCSIYFSKAENGAPKTASTEAQRGQWKNGNVIWTLIDTPKEGTTKISLNEGEKKEVKEEGGAVVAVRKGRNSYTLEFSLFGKAGVDLPFDDDDGVVAGEYSFLVVPEDPKAIGVQIDSASVTSADTFDTAEGWLTNYKVNIQKPASGKTLKKAVYAAKPKTT